MRAAVTHDQTVRTVTIEVAGAPDIDITRSWHRKPRLIRPVTAVLEIVDGAAGTVTVHGDLVLKNGNASGAAGGNAQWSATGGYMSPSITEAPEWVRLIWNTAPGGQRDWTIETEVA
jgi:hypothetical protein